MRPQSGFQAETLVQRGFWLRRSGSQPWPASQKRRVKPARARVRGILRGGRAGNLPPIDDLARLPR